MILKKLKKKYLKKKFLKANDLFSLFRDQNIGKFFDWTYIY